MKLLFLILICNIFSKIEDTTYDYILSAMTTSESSAGVFSSFLLSTNSSSIINIFDSDIDKIFSKQNLLEIIILHIAKNVIFGKGVSLY